MLMKKTCSYLPYIIFFICAILLFVRAFFGFCSSDEPFYLSTTKRLFEGDLIFAHDWFPTQLSSLILLPFYALFVTLTGSTSGIILYFRILYVLLTLILSLLSYRIISAGKGKAAAFSCAVFMLFYAHLNIATLSYYTLLFEFFVFSMVLFTVKKKSCYILGGFIFALSVLSLPSLVICYVLFFITLLIISFKNKEYRDLLLYSLIGTAAALLAFIIYLYVSGNSIGKLLEFLPYVLSDDEHQTSLVAPFRKFFEAISDVYGKVFYLNFILAFSGLLSNKYKKLLPYIFTMDLILFVYYAILSFGHTGYINTALALFAAPLFFMCDKKDWYSFISLFLGGLMVSMTYSYSSNGELYVLSIGHGISCIASIIFIFDFMRENGKIVKYTLTAVITVFLLQTALLRFINVYRDAPLDKLNDRIEAGPAAGLYTTKEHHDIYMSVYEDILKYSASGDTVLFSKLLPWGYLSCDQSCAAPTTWRNMINSKRLEEYYELYPDRIPDIIFMVNAYVGSYDSCGDILADPVPNENEFGGYLADQIRSGKYSEISSRDCTIYLHQ